MDYIQAHQELLSAIKRSLPQLKKIKDNLEDHWGQPDLFYRFYYQSFKAYRIQAHTSYLVDVFEQLHDSGLNPWFLQIVNEGTGKTFDLDHNQDWLQHTRPMVEAYLHAKMFLDLMIHCGENIESCGGLLDSRWAAVLILYGLR